ncbi:MAG: hypothetical protein PWQ17_190 [Anaerophaga sp.]|nr:hypothetical protein [Anaerophaga sp.]
MELACKSFIHVLLWKTLPCSFHLTFNKLLRLLELLKLLECYKFYTLANNPNILTFLTF